MQHNPITWFEIFVNDMARAHAFYEGLLDIKLEPQGNDTSAEAHMWVFPSTASDHGAGGALVKRVGDEIGDGGANILIYFSCPDCDTVLAKVDAYGGRVLKEKYAIGRYGYAALITDSEGNTIGLHSKH
ncbi:VOC family protein [Oceanisphaera avium]|uniref:VOC domain-containing protein n=1 Tax=Oceanisphaera avium TaxID=1903694 RepID=A0A1Y0CZ44_9GAMM|nr:VOC family protein [Oceanisphaera avium]ART80603.1 hypothetical protein CBP12_11000 [Oceanisphaera avium]